MPRPPFFVIQALRRRVMALAAGLALSGLAMAQGAQGSHGPLAEALDAAWQRHPEGAAASARMAQAQAGQTQAQGLTPAPGAISVGQKTDRFHGHAGLREWEVELATPLWLPGQRSARQTEAAHAAQVQEARVKLLRWQLAGEVREAWWALAQARTAAELAAQRVQSATALSDSVQRRHAKGDLARVDANLAQSEKLTAQSAQLEAQAALRQAEAAWRALTGLPAPIDQGGEPGDAAPAAASPADEHPQVRAARLEAALAQSRISLADASRRASPELALAWSSERSEFDRPEEKAITLRLTLPLSSGSQVAQDSAAARAELAQADAALARAQERLAWDIERTRAELDLADQQLIMARTRHQLAADNLQLAQRSFDLGEGDLPSLMRARLEAREAEAGARRQQLAREQALSRLLQAQGILP